MAHQKKKVLIVGAGAAGMSTAATLARHPDKFEVTVIEREEVAGGQATSIPLDKSKYGAEFLNDGVQGGSGIFRHTFAFFKQQGHEPHEVKLQISFGKGKDEFWSNVYPSQLVETCQKDIKRFGGVIKFLKMFEPVFALVPVRITLKLFMFSEDFSYKMVLPLMALFLGTGNQTPNVSTAILVRLFLDPNMKLWDYSPDTLLPNLPQMYTFPKLGEFYQDWVSSLRKQGVTIRLSHELLSVLTRTKKGVKVTIKKKAQDGVPEEVTEEEYDEIVFATLACDTLRLLGNKSSWLERAVLSSAKFFHDITVTHSDVDYFKKYYETEFQPDFVKSSQAMSSKEHDQVKFAKENFKPMYYTHSYPEDSSKIEMSFDCSNYQHQFPEHASGTSDQPWPIEKHVFQTIFLDEDGSNHLWTRDEIDKSKVIKEKWWTQLGHRWQHYLKVVPWMWLLNGKQSTWYAGSWTLVNMHELAVVSGIAVAYRLGADYPHTGDDFAESFFKGFLLLSHGTRYDDKRKSEF